MRASGMAGWVGDAESLLRRIEMNVQVSKPWMVVRMRIYESAIDPCEDRCGYCKQVTYLNTERGL